MRDVIDELSLKIDIDIEKGIDKTISSLAKAINKLNSAVSSSKGIKNLKAYISTLSKITSKPVKATSNTAVAQTITTPNQPEYEEIKTETEETAKALKKIDTEGQKASKSLSKVGKESKKTAKDLKDTDKETKKSATSFGKLVKSVGRIAFYRAIRTAIKELTDAFKEGFSNFVQFDEETNKSMSNVTNSVNQLKNSLGIGLASVLQTLEPLLISITQGLNGMADTLNRVMARLSGKSTYSKAIKQNEDYAKSLKDVNSALLSFDKFESLSDGNKNDTTSMFETVELPEETTETEDFLIETIGFVEEIGGSLKELFDIIMPPLKDIAREIFPYIEEGIKAIVGAVEWMSNTKITDDVSVLDGVLWGIVAVLGAIAVGQLVVIATNPIAWIVAGIVALMSIIGVLVKYWDNIVAWFKQTGLDIKNFFVEQWQGIANGFANIINWISNLFIKFVNICIDGLNTILKPIDAVAGIFGGNVEIPHWNATVNWQPYADGGMVGKGTRFIAGEAGAEVVATSSRGTGVTNIEQFTNAMYNALSLYGAARGTDVKFSGDVYIDKTRAGKLVEDAVYKEGVRVGHFSRK